MRHETNPAPYSHTEPPYTKGYEKITCPAAVSASDGNGQNTCRRGYYPADAGFRIPLLLPEPDAAVPVGRRHDDRGGLPLPLLRICLSGRLQAFECQFGHGQSHADRPDGRFRESDARKPRETDFCGERCPGAGSVQPQTAEPAGIRLRSARRLEERTDQLQPDELHPGDDRGFRQRPQGRERLAYPDVRTCSRSAGRTRPSLR